MEDKKLSILYVRNSNYSLFTEILKSILLHWNYKMKDHFSAIKWWYTISNVIEFTCLTHVDSNMFLVEY